MNLPNNLVRNVEDVDIVWRPKSKKLDCRRDTARRFITQEMFLYVPKQRNSVICLATEYRVNKNCVSNTSY